MWMKGISFQKPRHTESLGLLCPQFSLSRYYEVWHIDQRFVQHEPTVKVSIYRYFSRVKEGVHTTGKRAPQIKMSEKERINPIFACIFSYSRATSAAFVSRNYLCIQWCKHRSSLRSHQRAIRMPHYAGQRWAGVANDRSGRWWWCKIQRFFTTDRIDVPRKLWLREEVNWSSRVLCSTLIVNLLYITF